MPMTKERLTWIDAARGITIFLVVLGHSILPYPWLKYIFSFHVPLFFFLSGYLFHPQKYPHWFEFFKRKAFTLLLPYVVFFALNYIYWALRFNPQNFLDPLWQLLYASTHLYAPYLPLWFLTTLFVTEIYFYFLQKYLPKLLLLIAVIVSLIAGLWLGIHGHRLPWGVDIALGTAVFYYLGFQIKEYRLIEKLKSWYLLLVAVIFLGLNYFLAMRNTYQVSIFWREYGVAWLYLAAATTGILGYILITKLTRETVLKKVTLLDYLGKNSIIILGAHTVCAYFVEDFFNYQLHLYPKHNLLFAFIYTILTIIIITPIIYIFNRWLPFLIGRARKAVC
jgi:fucose 4-O-acetylase-like acetyltransferase